MRIDRFHNPWEGSQLSVGQWLVLFVHYYNIQVRIKRSADEHQPRRLSRQCPQVKNVFELIQQKHRYCHAIDDGNYETWVSQFADNTRFGGNTTSGASRRSQSPWTKTALPERPGSSVLLSRSRPLKSVGQYLSLVSVGPTSYISV